MTALITEGPMYLFTRCWPSPPGGRRRLPHHAALVWDHALDLGHVGLIKHHVFIELAFALRTFRSQDVALIRVTALDLARTCLLEALGRSAMCLQLRHSYLSITT